MEQKLLSLILNNARAYHEDMCWRYYNIDVEALEKSISIEFPDAKIDHQRFKKFCLEIGFSVFRKDNFEARLGQLSKSIAREPICESLGTLGGHFIGTRNRAISCAREGARESLYFGYGDFNTQHLQPPLKTLLNIIGFKQPNINAAEIFSDLRNNFQQSFDLIDLLQTDQSLNHEISSKEKYLSFQQYLRWNPFDGSLVECLSDFFNKKATIGIRDAMRWSIGSRHPWFDWDQAKHWIEQSFAKFKEERFDTPRFIYYDYDNCVEQNDRLSAEKINDEVVEAFARQIADSVIASLCRVVDLKWEKIAQWVLDIHHDYPDFELERKGKLLAETHASFIGNTIQQQISDYLFGESMGLRGNLNMKAHFQANGLESQFLNQLDPDEREIFYSALTEVLYQYRESGGIVCNTGIKTYIRLPASIIVFQHLGISTCLDGEKLLDSFSLSDMNSLFHAGHVRKHLEISEKLVVFFTLCLRHLLDTDFVPDLRPKDLWKDFMLLGLWGIRSEFLQIHLYQNANDPNEGTKATLKRSEIRFCGMDQVESKALDKVKDDGQLVKLIAAQITPLLKPSLCRALATFVMALEEANTGHHEQRLDIFAISKYSLNILRELSRSLVKGSLTNISNIFEYGLDRSLDTIQSTVDKIEQKVRSEDPRK